MSFSGLTTPAVAVDHGRQSKVFAQRPAFVLGAEQATSLQFRHYELDKVFAAAGQDRGRHVETVATLGFEPFLHGIGNVGGRTDLRRAGDAGAQV